MNATKATVYAVRYMNSAQGNPVESRHRTAEAAAKNAARLTRTAASGSGSDYYRAEEWRDGKIVAICFSGEWSSVSE